MYVCMYVCTAAEKTEKTEKKEQVVAGPAAPDAKTLPTPPPAADPSKVMYVCMYLWCELILLVTGSEATCAPSYIHYTCPG